MAATKARSGWHEARESATATKNRHADRRAELWNQMLRMESYLPRLHEQRDEAAERLAELDRLIADEENEARRIRASIM